MALAYAAMMGWCGTMWPGWIIWWILHHGGNPPPPPPDPWWRMIMRGVIGAIGGVIAVKIIGPDYQDAGLIGTGVLGFFGGVFEKSTGTALARAAASVSRFLSACARKCAAEILAYSARMSAA